jgi:hypothetical protein
MRKVYVDLTVRLILNVDEGMEVGNVVDELDYSFDDTTGSATVEDTEITGHEVVDSK